MGKNRDFKEGDGLNLDMGPFVVALEFAAGVEAVIIGKPSREFFAAAVDSTGCQMSDVIMRVQYNRYLLRCPTTASAIYSRDRQLPIIAAVELHRCQFSTRFPDNRSIRKQDSRT